MLLYRRIFVQKWFRNICWFFVAIFSAYMIATIIIDSCLNIPVPAYWDHSITPKRSVDLVKLYVANAGFNIATDSILLILPLTVVWNLSMSWQQKVGLTAVFAMGALTLVASIARLAFFHQVRREDISCKSSYYLSDHLIHDFHRIRFPSPLILSPSAILASQSNMTFALKFACINFYPDTLIPIVWWTSAELFLGILCPCLVTFRVLFRSAAQLVKSRLTSSRKGYWHASDSGAGQYGDVEHKSFEGRRNGSSFAPILGCNAPVLALGRDQHGMAYDQNFALASLDPSVRAKPIKHLDVGQVV